mmetsp:Transcript_12279/g.33132  ORF Transcript_12279/g.33132 Transcript_12279/m.33132 type:complete len:231 (-) Transcript_12279:154-846(-)
MQRFFLLAVVLRLLSRGKGLHLSVAAVVEARVCALRSGLRVFGTTIIRISCRLLWAILASHIVRAKIVFLMRGRRTCRRLRFGDHTLLRDVPAVTSVDIYTLPDEIIDARSRSIVDVCGALSDGRFLLDTRFGAHRRLIRIVRRRMHGNRARLFNFRLNAGSTFCLNCLVQLSGIMHSTDTCRRKFPCFSCWNRRGFCQKKAANTVQKSTGRIVHLASVLNRRVSNWSGI